jgi:glycosyltransferase involved in cell wall biosynthesis
VDNLVSCIMPTFNRRHLIPASLACYLSQDWESKELVVVDDGTDCVKDLFETIPGVRYFRTEKFKTLGDKVNFCCEQAQGEIIVTWDDDDWYAPGRITDQVTRLMQSNKAVTGYHRMMFFDGTNASQYRGATDYAIGNSQVYRKSFWESHRFASVDVGYDTTFSSVAKRENQIICVPGDGMAVARIHGKNVTGRRDAGRDSEQWPSIPVELLPQGFLEAR